MESRLKVLLDLGIPLVWDLDHVMSNFGFSVDSAEAYHINVSDCDHKLHSQGLKLFDVFGGSQVADI